MCFLYENSLKEFQKTKLSFSQLVNTKNLNMENQCSIADWWAFIRPEVSKLELVKYYYQYIVCSQVMKPLHLEWTFWHHIFICMLTGYGLHCLWFVGNKKYHHSCNVRSPADGLVYVPSWLFYNMSWWFFTGEKIPNTYYKVFWEYLKNL